MGAARNAAAAVLLALAAAGCSRHDTADSAFRPLDVGSAVPMYAARSLTGDTIHVGGAEPPTILNVWATWCTSCAEEMTTLDSLAREFHGRGVRVVAVSIDEGDDTRVRRFVAAQHLDFTVAHDPQQEIQRLYQLVGVPTTFVIAPDGRLVWRYTGNIGDDLADARTAVRATLTAPQ